MAALLIKESALTGSGAAPAWLSPFHPRRGLGNAHLQTLAGNYWPRPAVEAPWVEEAVLVDESDGSRVLCLLHWRPEPERASRLTVLLLHGLEGSVDSGYIRGLARRAWQAGCNVIRMNMRNCGGGEALTPTLYHSGLSADVARVVEHYAARYALERVAVVGYSMGGNMVLKMAGEWGAGAPLTAVAAVCPAIDLALGSDALHEPVNRLYERHFLRGLKARVRRKARLYPELYRLEGLGAIRSLREFDDQVVARFCGFTGADDYYHRASCARVVERIAAPSLVLCAADDPFIRLSAATRERLLANPAIGFLESPHGGHCAFLARAHGEEVHWAEATVMRFLLSNC